MVHFRWDWMRIEVIRCLFGYDGDCLEAVSLTADGNWSSSRTGCLDGLKWCFRWSKGAQ